MELNRQGLSLIEYLYDNGGQIQMSQICKYLSLSKRSLLYQVDKMNDFLRENQLSEIVSTGQRIMLSVEEQKKVEKILFSQESIFLICRRKTGIDYYCRCCQSHSLHNGIAMSVDGY